MRPTLSLDWNCIIEVEEERAEARAVRTLAEAHRHGDAEVALLATSASENMKGSRRFPGSYTAFMTRVAGIGFDDLPVLLTPGVWSLTYWDRSYYVDRDAYHRLRAAVWPILSDLSPDWKAHARDVGAPQADIGDPALATWRNAWCDMHSLICHIDHGRDWFVTLNTRDFQDNAAALAPLGAGEMLTPAQAAARLGRGAGRAAETA